MRRKDSYQLSVGSSKSPLRFAYLQNKRRTELKEKSESKKSVERDFGCKEKKINFNCQLPDKRLKGDIECQLITLKLKAEND